MMINDDTARHSRLFKAWLEKLKHSFTVLSTDIQSVDYAKRAGVDEILFIKLKATIIDKNDAIISRTFFLRGPSVALLVVLICEGIEYVVLVRQSRPAIGTLAYPELPAGMVEEETVKGSALRELEEETHLTITTSQLIDLAHLFYDGQWDGVYPSPGACDEIVHLFACRKEVDRETIEKLRGKKTGNRAEGEDLVLEVVKLEDLCVSTPDPKTHSAFVMYSHLQKKGLIP